VVIGGGAGFAARTTERFLARGVDVCTAMALDDLHTIAARKNPTAVILPVEAAGESGYLTCAKLRLSRPKLRVVLVGEASPSAERLARFVGARFATEATAADVVLKLI
jgi:DNA-binding response OmpR family regulator